MLDDLYKKNIIVSGLNNCSSYIEAIAVRYQQEACKSASGNCYVCDECPNHSVCDLIEHLETELIQLTNFMEKMSKL